MMNINYIEDIYLYCVDVKDYIPIISVSLNYTLGLVFPKADIAVPYALKSKLLQYKEAKVLCQLWLKMKTQHKKSILLLEGYINDILDYQTAKTTGLFVGIIHKSIINSWQAVYSPAVIPGNLVPNATPYEEFEVDVATPSEFLNSILDYITDPNTLKRFVEAVTVSPIAVEYLKYSDLIKIEAPKNVKDLFVIPDINFKVNPDSLAKDYMTEYFQVILSDIFKDMASMSIFGLFYKYIKLLNLELQFTPTTAKVITNVPYVTVIPRYTPELNISNIQIKIQQRPWIKGVFLLSTYYNRKTNKSEVVPLAYALKDKLQGQIVHLYCPEFLIYTFIYPIQAKIFGGEPVYRLMDYDEYKNEKTKIELNSMQAVTSIILENEAKYQYVVQNMSRFQVLSIELPYIDTIYLPGSYVIVKDLSSKLYAMISSTNIEISKKSGTAKIVYGLTGVIPESEMQYIKTKYFNITGHPWYNNSDERDYYVLGDEE